jgi:hypothetical protein
MWWILGAQFAQGSLGSGDLGSELLCASASGCGADYVSGAIDLKMRAHPEGQVTLNRILSDSAFWADAWKRTYTDKLYDEIRLKSTESGYVPMITGEGLQDFDHDIVADVVYLRNKDLPKYMSGAKVVMPLGSGFDPVVGAEYRDSFYILDLTVFYGYFAQRMYRKHDPVANQTVLWFEKMNASFVDAAVWTAYGKQMQASLDNLERRWPPFNALIEVSDIYGMFVVEPGATHTSRVSFVSKLSFEKGTGFVAQWGSQLPPVVRAGLMAGFDASVAIAKHETERRAKAATTPQAP